MDCVQEPWCRAIHECTACLREQNADDADICLTYLNILEERLTLSIGAEDDDDEAWNCVPEALPPDWGLFQKNFGENQFTSTLLSVGVCVDRSDRRFPGINIHLNARRLLARILTSQSEVFAMKASYMAKTQNDWTLAIISYQNSVLKIHRGLDVTDTAISRWWNRMEQEQVEPHGGPERNERDLLELDASIIVVALQSITDRRNKLMLAAKREETKLMRDLQPQWETRDEVKQRVGKERWNNNPRPKHDYARLRKESEDRLRTIKKAINALEELDPNEALQKANLLQEQLAEGIRGVAVGQQQNDHGNMERRYNFLRPSPTWIEQRVSIKEYPDPEDFGWTSRAAGKPQSFFEKMNGENKLIKLDWYFTTATVKTSLDHPSKGRTQLFAKKCDPLLYARVLTNPRTHTGKRYHHRSRSHRS